MNGQVTVVLILLVWLLLPGKQDKHLSTDICATKTFTEAAYQTTVCDKSLHSILLLLRRETSRVSPTGVVRSGRQSMAPRVSVTDTMTRFTLTTLSFSGVACS